MNELGFSKRRASWATGKHQEHLYACIHVGFFFTDQRVFSTLYTSLTGPEETVVNKFLLGVLLVCCTILTSVFSGLPSPAFAERGVEIPILAVRSNHPDAQGMFSIRMVWWDEQSEPNPISLQYGKGTVNSFQYGRVRTGRSGRQSTVQAFEYAVQRTQNVHHTGTINVQGIAYRSARLDGSSAGAVMAIGFIALLRGDRLERGVAMTGTLERDGSVGPVGGIRGKVRAAAREGYDLILIPEGQYHEPEWNLQGLEVELNVSIKEVSTIDEAYRYMTGETL